ncbi:LacI family DNA-binding transcriptional regulator [Micromonospora sp. NPDC005299]|uniref:LacI family DNA-binding transcriptional regulator n=1 Tax=Micromonospora sp. NPDC005299 TaxID=3364231 RepID=UPI003675C60E
MRATLKDVAKLANVSTKTVSNVINGYAYLRQETREKVERAIEQLNYRPNLTARNLRRGSTGLIALALPEIRNSYFAELAQLVVEEAQRHGLTVLIDCTGGVAEREQLVADGFHEQVIDGLILLPQTLRIEDLRRRHGDSPLVLLGERVADYADCIAIDSQAAARAATEHLVSLDRHRIGMIGGSRRDPTMIQRLRTQGYREALEDAGLKVDPALIEAPAAYTTSEGASAMARLLDAGRPVDAVFCHNDLLALGAMRTLLARGLRIPEDVAVIGIDDIEASRYATPSLSTIAPDKTYIARTAVRMLVDRFNPEGDGPPRRITVGFTLVARESTVGVRG